MLDRALPDDVVLRRLLPRVSVLVRMPDDGDALARILDRIPVGHEVLLLDGSAPDAVRDAARAATGDIVMTLDATAPQSPEEIPNFVTALCDGADVAVGTRAPARGRWSVLAVASRALFGRRCTDLTYARHACWRSDAARLLGAEDPPLVPLRAAREDLRVAEVPCRPDGRPPASPREVVHLLRLLVRERLRPRPAPAAAPGRPGPLRELGLRLVGERA